MNALRLCPILLLGRLFLPAQDLKQFEKKVTDFTLPNNLHFTIVERHDAPVVSFHTYVDVGSVDDPSGETGLAHMFEHMALKGTETIGTKDWANEKKALDAVEEAYDKFEAEQNKGPKGDQSRVSYLQMQLKNAIDRAQTYVLPNEYARIIEENGGVGANATASADATEFFYSLPSNRIEVWFLLESQRFLHPVFREFYKERDTVLEEHRMHVESSPQGRLLRQFRNTAFDAHPYRNPDRGWPSDIQALRRREAQDFFERYYVPGNMNIAIVGDVNPADARRLAEKYFGPMAARPLPPVVRTQEPPQAGPKQVAVETASQPFLFVGYKRPDQYDPSDAVFDVIQFILHSGRTGWMYKEMVQDKKIASSVVAAATIPGGRFPNLFVFYAVPSVGHSADENEKAIDDIVQRLKNQRVDAETLERAKTQARGEAIRRLSNNPELAKVLTTFYGAYGDWRRLFTAVDDLNKVTADDVQRAARRYFVPASRTTAYAVQPSQPGPRPPAGVTRK